MLKMSSMKFSPHILHDIIIFDLSSSDTVYLHIHPELQFKENSVTCKAHRCVLFSLVPSVLYSFGNLVYPGCVFP